MVAETTDFAPLAPFVGDAERAAMRLVPRNNEALRLFVKYSGDPAGVAATSLELRSLAVTTSHIREPRPRFSLVPDRPTISAPQPAPQQSRFRCAGFARLSARAGIRDVARVRFPARTVRPPARLRR